MLLYDICGSADIDLRRINMADKSNRGRSKQINIRLFGEEWNILETKARLAGKSKSDFIRDLIVLSEVKSNTILKNENFRQMLYELNRIGNNINQIAYNSNLKKSTGNKEIKELQKKYYDLLTLYSDTFLYPVDFFKLEL